jgi:hypothetical protein
MRNGTGICAIIDNKFRVGSYAGNPPNSIADVRLQNISVPNPIIPIFVNCRLLGLYSVNFIVLYSCKPSEAFSLYASYDHVQETDSSEEYP